MNLEMMHPRDLITLIMKRLYGYGMTTTSGGNLSILDNEGNMWISPGSVDKGTLRPEDIVCVKADGTIEGIHKPSSEFPFHRHIYKLRPDIKAVLHAHPAALVAFSITGRKPNTSLLTKASEICGEIGFAGYEVPGSEALGNLVSAEFEKGHNCILLQNHGVCTTGKDLLEAFERFETLDYLARIEIKAEALGKIKPLDAETRALSRTLEKKLMPEFIPAEHSVRECELREEMVKLINRSYNRMLSFSTDGTFSARVSPDQFLVTPKGLDRMNLRNDELVLIQDNYRELGKVPSRAAGFFKAIYDTHPWVNAIIVSKPVNIMGYAVTEEKIDTKTIPESYILLRDIVDIPCAEHYKDPMATVNKIAPNAPVIMLRNDCLLTVGSTLLQAFDRLEVAEFCANSLLASKRLGGVKPITEEQKKDLIKAFHLPE